MKNQERISRCGFVVAKFLIDREILYLMRRSKKWQDISFVGGHEMERDSHRLFRTAYRELLEEVPPLRKLEKFELRPVTDEFKYGPVYSRSAEQIVRYEMQFFLLKFLESPRPLLQALSPRSPNILFSERDLLAPGGYQIAGLVNALDNTYPGGIKALPLSWDDDLGPELGELYRMQKAQLELKLSA